MTVGEHSCCPSPFSTVNCGLPELLSIVDRRGVATIQLVHQPFGHHVAHCLQYALVCKQARKVECPCGFLVCNVLHSMAANDPAEMGVASPESWTESESEAD